jgi:hypothetical protein
MNAGNQTNKIQEQPHRDCPYRKDVMADKEMKTLFPGRTVTLGSGDTVEIRPVAFGKLNRFSEALASLFQKLQATGLKLESIGDWKVVFEVAFEETLGILGLLLDRPREWFDRIDLADGMEILDVVIEQNFNDRAKKNLRKIVDRLSSLPQMRSKPLSAQDIAGKIFEDTQSGKSTSSSGASSS